MSRRECPKCGLLLDMWQEACPNCGSSPKVILEIPDEEAAQQPASPPPSAAWRAINIVLALLLVAALVGVGAEYAKASRGQSQQALVTSSDAGNVPGTTIVNGLPVYRPTSAASGFWQKVKNTLEPPQSKRPKAVKPG
jgi:hypothetical protein